MIRVLFAWVLLCASAGTIACPLCLGAFQQSKAQQLVSVPHAVLAVPTADPSRFRVIEVVKGERPARGTIEGGYPRNGPTLEVAGATGKALLLVRDDLFPTWTILGTVGVEHARWLRIIATGKVAIAMNADEWRTRVALVLPYLEQRDPLVAEIAYGELAAAPYAALLANKSHIAAPAVRRWLGDPALASRQSLYLLLLGIAGDAKDAARLESRLDTARQMGDATSLGSYIAADLQLRGPARMAWVDEYYLRDRTRTTPQIEAALLALSVHGSANSAIPRERVIQSYRLFIDEHKDIAGFVAQDLATWQCWDAVPAYVAIMKSDLRQQYPSQLAIVAYLRQSPGAASRDPAPTAARTANTASRAGTAPAMPQ